MGVGGSVVLLHFHRHKACISFLSFMYIHANDQYEVVSDAEGVPVIAMNKTTCIIMKNLIRTAQIIDIAPSLIQ